MIASVVGTGLGLAGQVAGLIGSSKANKERQKLINQRRNHIQNWFDADYNQDFLNRSENRSAFAHLSNRLKERQQVQDNANAISGGTAEASVAEKGRNNEVYANFVNDTAARGTGIKEHAKDSYMQGMAGVDAAQNQLNTEKAANFANLGKMGVQAAQTAIQADGMGAFDKKEVIPPQS